MKFHQFVYAARLWICVLTFEAWTEMDGGLDCPVSVSMFYRHFCYNSDDVLLQKLVISCILRTKSYYHAGYATKLISSFVICSKFLNMVKAV